MTDRETEFVGTPRARMRPLADWPRADRAAVRGVLTDIDDTLTTAGAITPDALQALADLRAAGLTVIAITGRPTGWSAPFALAWPLAAIVAENGAAALRRGASGRLRKDYLQDADTRARNLAHLRRVLSQIEARVPGARRARDSAGRECDIAIDHSEFTHLPPAAIAACVRIMREAGLRTSVSSIHVNGWIGGHDKLEGARWIVRLLAGRDLDAELDRWVYVGDSTNDEVMFAHFPYTVGVANIRRFAAQLQHPPRYVTRAERGTGFAELARCLLAGRAG